MPCLVSLTGKDDDFLWLVGEPTRFRTGMVVAQVAQRLVPFALNDVARLAIATAAPALPLLLTIMPLEELVTRLLKTIF